VKFTRNTSKSKINKAFDSLTPAQNSTGTLWGEATSNPDQGHMDTALYKALLATEPVYVVCSYKTPIAWAVRGSEGLVWVIPNDTYSKTTTAHQNFIRDVVCV
jgi:hypothetical protein